jgi:hypothetical protein
MKRIEVFFRSVEFILVDCKENCITRTDKQIIQQVKHTYIELILKLNRLNVQSNSYLTLIKRYI